MEQPRLARPKGCYAVRDIRSIGEQSGRTTGRLGSTGLQSVPLEGRHSWHSGAHPPPPSSPGRITLSEGRAYQPEEGPRRRRRRRQPRDLDKSIMGRPEQLADAGRSDLELRGLNDYASTGSGPTRQSDARDSEPLHVSVAGARAGSLLFDTRSFFVCDADL